MSLMNSIELGNANAPESKYYKMKKVVSSIKEYLLTRAEEVAIIVNRYLQALSVTIDLSIFDPHTNIAAEFFVSLYELMSKIDQRSPFAWYCIDVLSNACRNSAARHALIHTYQFLPSLSRLLGEQLTSEKKVRLLRLMQDLTCGIKISWQIPHLPHLMVTLSKWIECKDEDIVALSLGVLVNLCYKNLPAIYTLSTNVDIKKIFRICLPLQGPIVEVHTCKLLIILDYMNGNIPKANLLKLVDATFKSMFEAFTTKDPILLRQIVEFFLDIRKQNIEDERIRSYHAYEKQVENLVAVLEGQINCGHVEGVSDTYDPECVALVFKFIHCLIVLDLPCLERFYPKFIRISLNWIETDVVSSESLAILKTIAVNTPNENRELLEPLAAGLPIFLVALNTTGSNDEIPTHTEHNKKIGALLQLLRAMLKVESLRPKILQELKEDTVYKVFYPLLGDNSSPRMRANDLDTSSEEAVNLYIYGIALVNELAKYDKTWVKVQVGLLEHRQLHLVMSQALYGSSKEVKSLILNMATLQKFPKDNVAVAMTAMQSMVHVDVPAVRSSHAVNELSFPVLSVAQIERLDQVLAKLKDVISERNLMDVSTSDVMELYEYKMASMGHAERAAMASVEAASERCTHLQHRTAQLTAELNRFHQLLFHSQQCHEQAMKSKISLDQINKELKNSFDAEKGRSKVLTSQLKVKERTLVECEERLSDTTKRLNEVTEQRTALTEQHAKLKQLVSKLEDNCKKLEQKFTKRDEMYKVSAASNENLKMQVNLLEESLKARETELANRNNELQQAVKDLSSSKELLQAITKLSSRHP